MIHVKNILRIGLYLIFFLLKTDCSAHADTSDAPVTRATVDSLNLVAQKYLDSNSTLAGPVAIKAKTYAEKLQYKSGLIKALLSVASIDEDSGKYEMAIKSLDKALSLSHEVTDQNLVARSLNNLGNIKNRQGNFEEAADLYMQALTIAGKTGANKLESDLLNNLAICYLEMENYGKSIEYHNRALKIREKENWTKEIAASLQNIGNVYFAQELDSLAMNYFKQSLELRQSIGDKSGEATSLNCVAAVYAAYELNEKAKESILKAIGIRKETGELNKLPQLYENLADIFGNEGDYKTSLSYLDEALKAALAINGKKDLRNIYQSFSATYEGMNDPVNALKNYKLYSAYKDSILNEKNNRHINDLLAKYESSEKENQIKLQQSEIGKQKAKTYYVGILFIFAIVIGALLFNRHRLKIEHSMQEERIESEKNRNKSMIMAQENERRHIAGELHDGLGQMLSAARLNIEALYSKTTAPTDPKLEKALSLIDGSFQEIRNISHRMMPVQLIRFGLTAAIKDVIDDYHKTGINFIYNCDDNIPRLNGTVEINIFRIIQEWINNVIKYASATEVSIQILNSDDLLTIMIEDNGKGFDTNLLDSGKGNGWYNINSRINMVNGKIEIDSSINKGTLVSIYVPIDQNIMAAA